MAMAMALLFAIRLVACRLVGRPSPGPGHRPTASPRWSSDGPMDAWLGALAHVFKYTNHQYFVLSLLLYDKYRYLSRALLYSSTLTQVE
eukprot:scaffold99753_cov36-Tisochrysis_lutea.AAC.1